MIILNSILHINNCFVARLYLLSNKQDYVGCKFQTTKYIGIGDPFQDFLRESEIVTYFSSSIRASRVKYRRL